MTTRNATAAKGDIKQDLGRQSERILRYLKSRTAEHWLMFTAGLLVGLILG